MRYLARGLGLLLGLQTFCATAVVAQETWVLVGGQVSITRPAGDSSQAGHRLGAPSNDATLDQDRSATWEIDRESTWLATFRDATFHDGAVTHVAGQIRLVGGLSIMSDDGQTSLDNWMIVAAKRENPDEYLIVSTRTGAGTFARVSNVSHAFDPRAGELVIIGDVSFPLGARSDSSRLRETMLGTLVIELQMDRIQTTQQEAVDEPAILQQATDSLKASSLPTRESSLSTGVGPDIIVLDLQGTASYGTGMTCDQSGTFCTTLADCNECSATGEACLIAEDCLVCSAQGVACQTDADCMTCANSGLPCTTNNDCRTCADDSNKSCVTNNDCTPSICEGGQTCDTVESCDVSGETCMVSGETCTVPIAAFAVGTTSCNIGNANALWIASTTAHPVIAQNLYRLKDNRFQQIGMSWVKHGFFAVNEDACGNCVTPPGQVLGPGCSDPYSASLNGDQQNLGPRSDVNAFTGEFLFPFSAEPPEPKIGRRLQVREADLDPALNAGARYFIEGQYVSFDEANAGHGENTISYREIAVEPPNEENNQRYRLINPPGGSATQQQQAAIEAWALADPDVALSEVRVPGEGKLILGARASLRGDGMWSYEYALFNVNSDRAVGTFGVQLPDGATVVEDRFFDVDYHSGEPFARADWPVAISANSISWSTTRFETDPNANALRWGTQYNFSFVTNAEPTSNALVPIGFFKSGGPGAESATTIGPMLALIDCNDNGIADECDISCDSPGCTGACGGHVDCNANRVPDMCEADCNNNGIADACDIRDCPAGDLSCADCNGNTVPDGCPEEIHCDADGIPSNCDDDEDLDDDGFDDCVDACPNTHPGVICDCPLRVLCCFVNLPPAFCTEMAFQECLDNPLGIPQCDVEGRCRDGCLVGDYDADADLDLKDVAGFQRCFDRSSSDPTGLIPPADECLRVFDFDTDNAVILDDFQLFETFMSGPQ